MSKVKGQRSNVNKTVFVGLSGGVDSSVSAALLKKANPKNFKKFFGRPAPKGFKGYEVVGVFIKVWQPDWLECSIREDRRDAIRVCAKLGIPFLEFDFSEIYKKGVVDYMIEEYREGRTPNPDVMCNKEVKFGAFLKKALEMGAQYVATGHYARVLPEKFETTSKSKKTKHNLLSINYLLLTGLDPTKDQSYFLWTLAQKELKHVLFPVGHLKKSAVRILAKKYGLPTAEKKDSQGICFLGKLDMKDFLKHYIKEKKGAVVLAEGEAGPPRLGEAGPNGLQSGQVIGEHDGATFFTLGERHGFTITKKTDHDGPYYVVGKDVNKNILMVSQHPAGKRSLGRMAIKLKNTNWILARSSGGAVIPKPNQIYTAQIRYHGELLPCKIKILNKNKAEITFKNLILAASGQSCVIYDGEICLGGGVIV